MEDVLGHPLEAVARAPASELRMDFFG